MLAVVVSIFFLAGCNFGGPSEKEVVQALDAAMRAFADSVDQKTPAVEESYSNAIDLVFRNDDESLIHQMNVLLNDADVTVYGDCEISEYEDYFASGFAGSGLASGFASSFTSASASGFGAGFTSGLTTGCAGLTFASLGRTISVFFGAGAGGTGRILFL